MTTKILPNNFGKACQRNPVYGKWRKEFPDSWTMAELEFEWRTSQERFTKKELLEVYPEASAYLKKKSVLLRDRLSKEKQIFQEQTEKIVRRYQGFSRWFWLLVLKSFTKDTADYINKEIADTNSYFQPIEQKGDITKTMIERAKAVQIKDILRTEADFISCPFHKEKTPSFYIRGNFGYCFSCQESCDSIAFLQKTQNLTFPEAVSVLQNY